MSGRAREQYGFPVLQDDEILLCMEELHLPITHADLAKPTGQHFAKVVEGFLDLLMGVTRDEIEPPSRTSALESQEFPDLYLQSLRDLAIFRSFRNLMSVAGVGDVSLKDLTKPESPRVRLLLSALINFAKFREMELGNFEKLTEKTEELQEMLIQREQENQKLEEQYAARLKQRADEEPRVRVLQEKSASLLETVNQLNKEQQSKSSQYKNLKDQETMLKEQIDNANKHLAKVKAACADLKSKIVENPEKLKVTIQEMDQQLQAEREAVQGTDKKSRELQAKIDGLVQLEQDIERVIKTMQDCEATTQKVDETQKKINDANELLVQKEAAKKQLQLQDQNLKRQMAVIEDKIARQHRQQSMKREQMESKMNALRQEHLAVSHERAAIKAKLDEQEAVIQKLETRIKDVKQAHEAEMAGARSDFAQLMSTVGEYTAIVQQSLVA